MAVCLDVISFSSVTQAVFLLLGSYYSTEKKTMKRNNACRDDGGVLTYWIADRLGVDSIITSHYCRLCASAPPGKSRSSLAYSVFQRLVWLGLADLLELPTSFSRCATGTDFVNGSEQALLSCLI